MAHAKEDNPPQKADNLDNGFCEGHFIKSTQIINTFSLRLKCENYR